MIAVLLTLENQLTEEQRRGALFFALKKLAPHMVKDLRKIPEDQLQQGTRAIAAALLAACDGVDIGPVQLSVMAGGQ